MYKLLVVYIYLRETENTNNSCSIHADDTVYFGFKKFVPAQPTMVSLCKRGLHSPIMIGDIDGTCEMREKLNSALFSYFKFSEFSTWTVGGSDPNYTWQRRLHLFGNRFW